MNGRGYTLAEMLVMLAMTVILLAIAVPGYAILLNSSRLSAATNDLVTALHLARSEAVKRGAPVTVCKTTQTGGGAPTCETSASWHQGWMIFADSGVRGEVDVDDQVLWIQRGLHQSVSINAGTAFGNFITYLPNGRSQGSNNLPNGTIKICVSGSRRDIIINNVGRPRLASGAC